MTRTSRSDAWIARFKPNPGAEARLFCFPYAGGAAPVFRAWADRLPRTVEVCPVQFPGRGSRIKEAPFTSLPPLIDALDSALAPYRDKPAAFFGHSLGAVVAFELARRMRRDHGLEPLHLFVSGRRAPDVAEPNPGTYALPEDEFVAELRRLNGTPKEVLSHPELMDLMIPLLRADFQVAQTYEHAPEPPLGCPITAFGGGEDPEAPPEDIAAWRRHTSAPFAYKIFPGDHFFLHQWEPALLQIIASDLQRALEARPV